jgi:hypothetical protein
MPSAFQIVYMFAVLSMNMCYFCWFVQAYAAARFAESCIRALDGDSDVYECAYVQSEVRTTGILTCPSMQLNCVKCLTLNGT